ncbi:E3 ubiquitin-protein ligase HTD1, partial [Quaeritorhiza haematococci]
MFEPILRKGSTDLLRLRTVYPQGTGPYGSRRRGGGIPPLPEQQSSGDLAANGEFGDVCSACGNRRKSELEETSSRLRRIRPFNFIDLLRTGAYSDFEVVGPDGVTYALHRFVLSRSDFFLAAFDGGFRESQANKMTLHFEDQKGVFPLVFDWLYGADIDLAPDRAYPLLVMADLLQVGDLVEALQEHIRRMCPSDLVVVLKDALEMKDDLPRHSSTCSLNSEDDDELESSFSQDGCDDTDHLERRKYGSEDSVKTVAEDNDESRVPSSPPPMCDNQSSRRLSSTSQTTGSANEKNPKSKQRPLQPPVQEPQTAQATQINNSEPATLPENAVTALSRELLTLLARSFDELPMDEDLGFLPPTVLSALLDHRDLVVKTEYQVYRVIANYCGRDRPEYTKLAREKCTHSRSVCERTSASSSVDSTKKDSITPTTILQNKLEGSPIITTMQPTGHTLAPSRSCPRCMMHADLTPETIRSLFERVFFEYMTEIELREVAANPSVPKEFVIHGLMEMVRKLKGQSPMTAKPNSRRNSTIRKSGGDFSYVRDMDENGVLFFLGTLDSTHFRNPCTAGQVRVHVFPALKEGQPSTLVSRQPRCTYTVRCEPGKSAWFVVDFCDKWELRATHYTLRHGYSQDTADALRNWCFQGSSDGGKTWRTISAHFNEDALGGEYGTHTWAVSSDTWYSQFKIETMGHTSSILVICGIELYGHLKPKPGITIPSASSAPLSSISSPSIPSIASTSAPATVATGNVIPGLASNTVRVNQPLITNKDTAVVPRGWNPHHRQGIDGTLAAMINGLYGIAADR